MPSPEGVLIGQVVAAVAAEGCGGAGLSAAAVDHIHVDSRVGVGTAASTGTLTTFATARPATTLGRVEPV